MRYLLIISLTALLISSCNDINKRVINYENLEKDLAFFKDKKNDLNEIQKEFLKYLSTYKQNPEIKPFINLLNDSSYTYSRAFIELTKFNNEIIRLKKEKENILKAVDDTCIFIQQKVDIQKHLRDSINSFVKPVINIARKTTWDYYFTAIEIDSRIINCSHRTINYLSFDYILRKNNSVSYKIPCVVDLPVIKKLQRDFIFDDVEHARIYKNLESYGLPFYSADYQVKKIVFANGNAITIDKKYYTDDRFTDKQYRSPSKLEGECPYLSDSDFHITFFRQLNTRINTFLNENSPVLSPFLKWYLNH